MNRDALFRVNRFSWWKEELPDQEDYRRARDSLERANWQVDCVITHCAHTSVQDQLARSTFEAGHLTVAVYSIIQAWMGRESETGTLIADIVGSTGVIDLVVTFILEFIIGKLLYYICIPVHRALPAGLQATLRDWSDRGERRVQREKDRREQWARGHDFLQNPGAWDARGAQERPPPLPFFTSWQRLRGPFLALLPLTGGPRETYNTYNTLKRKTFSN